MKTSACFSKCFLHFLHAIHTKPIRSFYTCRAGEKFLIGDVKPANVECKKPHFCPHCDHWQKKRHQCFAEPHGSNRNCHCNTAGPSQPKFHDLWTHVPHAWPGFTKTAVTHFITVGKAVVPSPRHAPHTQGKAVCPKKRTLISQQHIISWTLGQAGRNFSVQYRLDLWSFIVLIINIHSHICMSVGCPNMAHDCYMS